MISLTSQKKGYGLLLGLIVGIVPCEAKLGESYNQSVQRYGDAVAFKEVLEPDNDIQGYAEFQKNGLQIEVLTYKNVAAAENFTKANGSALTSSEIEIILNVELNNGEQWKLVPATTAVPEHWEKADGAHAIYNKAAKKLTILSKDWVKRPLPKGVKSDL